MIIQILINFKIFEMMSNIHLYFQKVHHKFQDYKQRPLVATVLIVEAAGVIPALQ